MNDFNVLDGFRLSCDSPKNLPESLQKRLFGISGKLKLINIIRKRYEDEKRNKNNKKCLTNAEKVL